MNYYEILEVSPNASPEVIKAAYRSLMQRYHPDRNAGDARAAQRSVAVVQAYEVLSDPGKRAAYDSELKLQLASTNNIQVRAGNILVSASSDDAEGGSRWGWWLLITLIVLALWFVLSPFEKKQSSGKETKGPVSLLGGYQQQSKAGDRVTSIEARTIPVYMSDINVHIEAPAESGNVYFLSIQTMGFVAGAFDSDKFISLMEDNKEYIGWKLEEKLSSAKYDMLIKHNGDRYLKQVILDAIGEITGTDRLEEHASSGTEPAAHYGVVDILLPDSFSIKPQVSPPATVP
jgi:curved DNA-binding protein CbpA